MTKCNIPSYVYQATNVIKAACDKHSCLSDLDVENTFPITFKIPFPFGDLKGALETIEAIHADLGKAKVGTTRIVIEPTEVTWTALASDPSIREFHDKKDSQ